MSPNISAATARAYNTRLLHSDPARFTEEDLAARGTLITLCALLEPHDPPSASSLGSRVISDYHAAWIRELPGFPRVGYLNRENDFYSGEPCLRLYLYADWLETREGADTYHARLAARSTAWTNERIRWYRLRRRLQDVFDIGREAAQAQIAAHFATLHCRHEPAVAVAKRILQALGFEEEITQEDQQMYEHAHISAIAQQGAHDGSSHAYSSVLDFKDYP